MKFTYKKEASVNVGQKLYGIVADSRYTEGGCFLVTVDFIDYNNEEVVFVVDQPCNYVYCSFSGMEYFVFESKEEAEGKISELAFGTGLWIYHWE